MQPAQAPQQLSKEAAKPQSSSPEQAAGQGKPDVPQNVVAGAHEESMAAAEQASRTLHSGEVPKHVPGTGEPTGDAAPAVSVGLPSEEEERAALRPPRAVEPVPVCVATTNVDPDTFYAPTRWPGGDEDTSGPLPPEERLP